MSKTGVNLKIKLMNITIVKLLNISNIKSNYTKNNY